MNWQKLSEAGFPEEGRPVLVKDENGLIDAAMAVYVCADESEGWLWERHMYGPLNDPDGFEADDDYKYFEWVYLPLPNK